MYVSMKEMLDKANKEGYAVMAINCFNLETARSVIRAAELEEAPVIVNLFQDHLLGHCDSELIVPIVKTLTDRSKVDVALNYDHGQDFASVRKAIDDGFSSVMVDASLYEYEENIRITKDMVEYAHDKKVSVEAELGCMGASEGGELTTEAMMTDPDQAKDFAERTGIDCLAISCGTSHGNYPDGMVPDLDFERIKKIKELTHMPLVLHGGSGAGERNIRKAVENGINKINVGCDFMNANRDAAIEILEQNRKINFFDFVEAVEEKSIELIRYYIKLSGSVGKMMRTK